MKKAVLFVLIALSLSQANASEYFLNGKKITKGEAMLALMKDPSANVVKQDRLVFNTKKGTLKTAPKDE